MDDRLFPRHYKELIVNKINYVVIIFIVLTVIYLSLVKKLPPWVQRNEVNNKPKWINKLIGILVAWVFGPLSEETLFRLPLLLLFDEMTATAWFFNVFTSLIFGFAHWRADLRNALRLSVDNNDDYNDKPLGEKIEILSSQPEESLAKKAVAICATTILGLISGYIIITKQSIMAAYITHVIWNFSFLVVLPLIGLILILIVRKYLD